MKNEEQHLESDTKIYVTNEYKDFKKIKGNRVVNDLKVQKIIKSIREKGINVLKYAPIIVNENMAILDGSHRFAVCKELKHPVYYVVSKLIKEDAIPVMNSNSSNWVWRDYLNYFVSKRRSTYQKLNEFLKEYPRMSIAIAAALLHNGREDTGAEVKEVFREGALIDRHHNKAVKLAELCRSLEEYTNNPYSRRMISALRILSSNDKYNHNMMLTKLEKSGKRIDGSQYPKEIISQMELIMNHGAQKRIYIS